MNDKKRNNSKRIFRFYAHHNDDTECIKHMQVSCEIVLVLSGEVIMEIGGREYSIGEGYGAFITSLVPHAFRTDKHNTCRIIEFSRNFFEEFFPFSHGRAVVDCIFPFSDEVRNLTGKYLNGNRYYDDPLVIGAVLAPLAYEIREGCTFQDCLRADSSLLIDVLGYIDDNFKESISLSSAAQHLGVHPVSISRVVSSNTFMTFNEYLKFVRCTHAARLINGGGMTFSEISYECGFGSIRSFNRAFLDFHGMTPKDYKRLAAERA